MTERYELMTALQTLLHQRLGIEVAGDDIYWDDAHAEARVRIGAETWYAARFDLGHDWATACGLIMTCPHCGEESDYRFDITTPDEYAAVTATGAPCLCGGRDATPDPSVIATITLDAWALTLAALCVCALILGRLAQYHRRI